MALRVYVCTNKNCNQSSEKLTTGTPPGEVKCLYCNEIAVLETWSPGSFALKGSGWYQSGYS